MQKDRENVWCYTIQNAKDEKTRNPKKMVGRIEKNKIPHSQDKKTCYCCIVKNEGHEKIPPEEAVIKLMRLFCVG